MCRHFEHILKWSIKGSNLVLYAVLVLPLRLCNSLVAMQSLLQMPHALQITVTLKDNHQWALQMRYEGD